MGRPDSMSLRPVTLSEAANAICTQGREGGREGEKERGREGGKERERERERDKGKGIKGVREWAIREE